MPSHLKELVRARMEKTGESYQQALRYREDPVANESRERIKRFAFPAALNLQKLLGR